MFFINRVPPRARRNYRHDAMAGMLFSIMNGLTGAFFAVIAREQLNAGAFLISIITMAPVIGNILALFWAKAVEGKPKMPLALRSWIVARSLLFLMVFAVGPGIFTIIVAAFWVLSSVSGPAYSSIMKEIYPDSDRARIMAYVRVCMVGVAIFVTAVAGPLLKVASYRIIFPLSAIFGIWSAFEFAKIRAEECDGDSTVPMMRYAKDSLLVLKHDKAYLWFCAGIYLFGGANFLAAPVYTIYQVDVLGVDTRWASVYAVIAQILSMLTYVRWGAYIDKKNPHCVVILSAFAWGFIPLIYIAARNPWMILPAAVIMGLLNSAVELSYFTGVLHYAPKDKIPQYQAVFASLMGLRGITAPFIGAALFQTKLVSMQGIFLISAVLIFASCLVQYIGMRKYDHFPPLDEYEERNASRDALHTPGK